MEASVLMPPQINQLQSHEMNSFMYAQYAAIALDENKMEEALGYIEAGKQLEDQSNIKHVLILPYYQKTALYASIFFQSTMKNATFTSQIFACGVRRYRHCL